MSDSEHEAAGARWAEDLILELGEYAPLEMLIRARRLGYADYQAWRRGEFQSLDDRLRGNRERIAALLHGAADHCRRRKLEARRDEWTAWGDDRRPLALAGDPDLDALLATRYAPPDDRIQGDLFENSAETVLAADLERALTAGDREPARRALDRLAERHPDHPQLGAYERLVAGLTVPDPIGDPGAYLRAILDELEPAARERLRTGYRDYLAPHWAALGRALDGRPFDPREPCLHASYAGLRRDDWEGVCAAVTAEPAWRREPILLERLLVAARYLGDDGLLLEAACRLCWDCPEAAPAALLRDPGLGPAWRAFEDIDLDPPLATEDFPAWYVLTRRYAVPLLEDIGNAAARERAAAAAAVIGTDPLREDRAHRQARQRLQEQDPRLLRIFLACQSVGR